MDGCLNLYAATRTVRERVFNDTTGAGTTGVDHEYAKAYFANVGAEIIGAGMLGLASFFAELSSEEGWTVLDQMEFAKQAPIFGYLPHGQQAEFVRTAKADRLARIVTQMPRRMPAGIGL